MTIVRNCPPIHPDSSKWYWLIWNAAELGADVTIDTASWDVATGLVQDAVGLSGLSVGIRLSVSGGVEDQYYDVTCEITTSANETLHETLRILISSDAH